MENLKPSQIDNSSFGDSLARNVQMEALMRRLVDYSRKQGDTFLPFEAATTNIPYGDSTVNFAEKYRHIRGIEAIDINLFDMKDGMMIPNDKFYAFMSFFQKVDTKDLDTLITRLNEVGFEKINNILVSHNIKRRELIKPEMDNLKQKKLTVYSSLDEETTREWLAEDMQQAAKRRSHDYYNSNSRDIGRDYYRAQAELEEIADQHGAKLIDVHYGDGNHGNHLVVGNGEKSRHCSIMGHNLDGSYDKDYKWTNKPRIDYYGPNKDAIVRDIPSLGK